MGMLSFRGPCGEVDRDPPPPCSPGLQVQTVAGPAGLHILRGLLGFEGEPDDLCQPLQGGLGDL